MRPSPPQERGTDGPATVVPLPTNRHGSLAMARQKNCPMRLTDRIGVAYISSRWFGAHLQTRATRGFEAYACGLGRKRVLHP